MANSRIAWLSPSDPPEAFPPIDRALREPDGLVAAGGDLSSDRLLYAYRHGIFPWYDEGQPVLWWSPDPRCVLRPDEFHAARRLRRDIKASDAFLTFNQSFDAVIRGCAEPRRYERGTWITTAMLDAYTRLHESGWAHSVEIRTDDQLLGGVYGLAIGKVFFGESMFSATPNASKIALFGLCEILRRNEFQIIDCQVISPHLLTLGATTLPRREFAAILESACSPVEAFDNWPSDPMSVSELCSA